MSIFHALLTDRAVLRIGGNDRIDFMQNLVTQDVARPQNGACVMAALLTPQGKLLYDFLIYVEEDALLIDCEAAQAEALAKKLSLYKLRADVTIEATDLHIHALWQEDGLPCPPMSEFYQDPRNDGLGLRGFSAHRPTLPCPKKALMIGTPIACDAASRKGQWKCRRAVFSPSNTGLPICRPLTFKKAVLSAKK